MKTFLTVYEEGIVGGDAYLDKKPKTNIRASSIDKKFIAEECRDAIWASDSTSFPLARSRSRKIFTRVTYNRIVRSMPHGVRVSIDIRSRTTSTCRKSSTKTKEETYASSPSTPTGEHVFFFFWGGAFPYVRRSKKQKN